MNNKGFTLAETLVIILVLGILAAIALPSLFSAINRSKEAEGIMQVGVYMRAMQAYIIEHETFPDSTEDLKVGANPQNYEMLLRRDSLGKGAVGAVVAETKEEQLRSFAAVVMVPNAVTFQDRQDLEPKNILTLTCRSEEPGEQVRPFFIREIDVDNFECKKLRGNWQDVNKKPKKNNKD